MYFFLSNNEHFYKIYAVTQPNAIRVRGSHACMRVHRTYTHACMLDTTFQWQVNFFPSFSLYVSFAGLRCIGMPTQTARQCIFSECIENKNLRLTSSISDFCFQYYDAIEKYAQKKRKFTRFPCFRFICLHFCLLKK